MATITIIPSRRSDEQSSAQLNEAKIALHESLGASLRKIVEMLQEQNDGGDDIITYGIAQPNFREPLSKHEMQVLGCALYTEKRGCMLSYQDVLRLTDQFSGKAMNITMVYKTIDRLIDRGMLKQEGVNEKERPSRTYKTTQYGQQSFKVAVVNARALADQDAA